jgi:hypothetical protein
MVHANNNNNNSKYDTYRFEDIEESQVNPDRGIAAVASGQKP